MTEPRYLTVPALAESLGVDQAKVLAWIHQGELRAINVAENPSGRPRWRIPVAAWDEFCAGRSNRPPTPPPAPRRRRRADPAVTEFY